MSIAARQTIRILELLAPERGGMRISDLAESLGTNRAIPYRHLQLLMELGYVEQDPATERYWATYRLGALGLRQLENSVLDWAQQHLDELARRTQELVRLGAVSDDRVVWVGRAQGSNSTLIIDPASGAEARLHATASGKAYLSTLPRERVIELLGAQPLEAMATNTRTDVEVVLAEVDEARRCGYAIVEEEMDVGVIAMATPIVIDPGTPAVATLSVAGPSVRLDRGMLESFVDDLKDVAKAIATEWPAYRYIEHRRADQLGTGHAGHR